MPLIPSTINPQTASTSADPNEHWTNLLVGKKIGDKSDAETFDKKELPQKHRVVNEGDMMTMDWVEDRLNVHLDKDGKVAKVNHG